MLRWCAPSAVITLVSELDSRCVYHNEGRDKWQTKILCFRDGLDGVSSYQEHIYFEQLIPFKMKIKFRYVDRYVNRAEVPKLQNMKQKFYSI